VRCIDYIEDTYRTLDWYVAQIEVRNALGQRLHPARRARPRLQDRQVDRRTLGHHGAQPVSPMAAWRKASRVPVMFPRVWFDEVKGRSVARTLETLPTRIGLVTNEPGAPLHDAHSMAPTCCVRSMAWS